MRFSEVIGQEKLKSKLIAGVRHGRIPHAQLFLGKSGFGGLPLALAYTQYISCKNPSETDSCGECPSCRKMNTITHPDVHFSFPFPSDKAKKSSELMEEWRNVLTEQPYINLPDWMLALGAEKKQANFPIAECREIIRSLSLKPFESEYKFLILWLPEFLGNEGNVLLKIIEEPPHNTIFLIVAENEEKILGTILSRTQPVKVPPLLVSELKDYLVKSNNLTDEEATRVAHISHGDFNESQKFATGFESPFFDTWRGWMALCYGRKMGELVAWAESSSQMGKESLKGFLQYGLELLRGVLVTSYSSELNSWGGSEAKFIANMNSIGIPFDNLEVMCNEIERSIGLIERNAQPKMVLLDLSFIITRKLKI
jgi:DNA polymerase-3 subunit delta'